MIDLRFTAINEVIRYDREYDTEAPVVGGHPNFWFLQQAPDFDHKSMQLESGINGVKAIVGPDGTRTPAIALRSSPWKAGQDSTPWHDEFDLDHGHVRYFGDHKVSTLGPVGATKGNRQLLEAWRLHASGDSEDRSLACPLLVFRASPTVVDGVRKDKGYLEFCGVGIMERLEYFVQRDPAGAGTFPNLVVDLDIIKLDENDEFDWRWIDDRRNPELTATQALRYAPESWRHWVQNGRAVLSRIRRRVLTSPVLPRADQLPQPGGRDDAILQQVYHAFDDNKHAFEWLASRIAERVLTKSGAHYNVGWLTRSGGDGGMDFVGRLDVGTTSAKTPLVVLGQAKCIQPNSIISPDQVARVVARLRRGWIGVFVTTGTFSKQAQVEIIDDEYPIILVNGKILAETVHVLAEESHGGDVAALLQFALDEYPGAITNRRPSEILGAG